MSPITLRNCFCADAACRQHDVEYMLGMPPEFADSNLLLEVQRVRPDIFPLFAAAMYAKNLFQEGFGKDYTSYLYFYPAGFQPSLTFHFAIYSVLDSTPDHTLERKHKLDEVRLAEGKWMRILQNIWLGSCYIVPSNLADTSYFKVHNYFNSMTGSDFDP